MSEHTIKGWTFEISGDTAKPLPWVYRNVRNHAYNFASEISIERIIVEVEEAGVTRPISLKFSDFESITGEASVGLLKHDLKQADYALSLANFSVYEGNGLLLRCTTKKGVLPVSDSKEMTLNDSLDLFFVIIFADYGDPPHEFSGALQAARFTPVLRFETTNPSVQSIRVDYRFHFDLDSYLKDASVLTKLAEDIKKKTRGIENYASLIRDADHFPPSVLATINLLKEVFALPAELEFFFSQLAAYYFDIRCLFDTTRLELEISQAGTPTGDGLNISFRDPRTSLTNAPNGLDRTFRSLTDEKVVALRVASLAEYDESVVVELTEKVFTAIVGSGQPVQWLNPFPGQTILTIAEMALPGITDACLRSNIKYLLVKIVFANYRRLKAASIARQLKSVRQKMGADLADIFEYLGPDEAESVFRDIDNLLPVLLQDPLPGIPSPVDVARVVKLAASISELAGKILSIVAFDAAEKPVLYEVVGNYVENGEVTGTWDNLHWWGTEKIPSSPGAFHAVHSHYRWTQLNAYPTADEAKILDLTNAFLGTKRPLHYGTPQLRSLVKRFAASGLSGPLIDPAIPNQTISCAVALNGGTVDEKLKKSEEPFGNLRAKPEEIARISTFGNSGKDIVYWLSCKAARTEKDIFRGTLLVNGFYFAHDEEKPFSLFRPAEPANLFGATEGVALHKPRRKQPYELFRRPDR
jgi:hypothetical protein